ncbi:peptide ABC transporter substrate-binding protein [Paenibacillus sp. HN-1]|uniref:peptide ABC transporter substrate-binding protein n=1 Tax=Paenibacillus TaxID=44249 RepID=UPI001CA8272B|nr:MULTISPECIES: peptide ABC transporter substrate-binding protein [Paenibacillus]MBY9079675.1 peptide ABC transporter substrate-binding protein [Paenibacillus sp. CGMCC 1.18879]MBY9082926.1 peptide ABC transporter substrate-binding protein [Paenibacillus sinensis]
MIKRIITWMLCLLVLMTGLAHDSWAAGREQIFRFNLYANPISLDPALTAESISDVVIRGIMEGLVRTGKNGEIQPAVAKSWTVSQDGKTYTFKLRSGAVWTNKQKVKASDFEYAWKRVLNPATGSPQAYMLFYLAGAEDYYNGKLKDSGQIGVKAVDDTTLQVTLRSRTPYFLQLAATRSYLPVNPAVVKKNPNWAESAQTFVGNGPFTLTKWVQDNEIVLTKNVAYFSAGDVHFKQVRIGIQNDPDQEIASYKAGSIDWSQASDLNITSSSLDKAMKNDAHTYNPASTYYFVFNVTKPPFDNVNIRKALAMSIVREQVTSSTPAYAFVPPGILGVKKPFREEATTAFFREDAGKARELLKKGLQEEGLTKFPETTLIYNEGHEYISSAVTEMWEETLGIKVNTEEQPWEELLSNSKDLNYDIARAGWSADYNDPASFLEIFTSWSTDNDSGWSNPQYDAYMRSAMQTADPTARMKLYRQAEQLLMDQMVIIPIHYFKTYALQKSYVHDVYYNYSGGLVYRDGYLK